MQWTLAQMIWFNMFNVTSMHFPIEGEHRYLYDKWIKGNLKNEMIMLDLHSNQMISVHIQEASSHPHSYFFHKGLNSNNPPGGGRK